MIKLEKSFNRISVKIFNIKFAFVLKPTIKNYYISLGTNCYTRTMLTKFGIKAKKQDGELTCPFDLCVTPVKSISIILENKFSDYLNDLEYEPTKKLFINKKYNIKYLHDNDVNIDKLKIRYEKRIKNFIELSKRQPKLVYIITIFDNEFETQDIENIYNSLNSYREGKPFKLFIISFVNEKGLKTITKHSNIQFREYIPLCKAEDYAKLWPKKGTQNTNQVFKNIIEDIKNL